MQIIKHGKSRKFAWQGPHTCQSCGCEFKLEEGDQAEVLNPMKNVGFERNDAHAFIPADERNLQCKCPDCGASVDLGVAAQDKPLQV